MKLQLWPNKLRHCRSLQFGCCTACFRSKSGTMFMYTPAAHDPVVSASLIKCTYELVYLVLINKSPQFSCLVSFSLCFTLRNQQFLFDMVLILIAIALEPMFKFTVLCGWRFWLDVILFGSLSNELKASRVSPSSCAVL